MDPTWTVNGDAVRALREDAWFSQEELAEISGVSAATISKIEQGRRPQPHPKTMKALAKALKVDPDILRKSPNGEERLAKILRARQVESQGDGFGSGWDLGRAPNQAAFAQR